MFHSERELLKVRRQNTRKADHDETDINIWSCLLLLLWLVMRLLWSINSMAHTPDTMVYFAGGMLLIKKWECHLDSSQSEIASYIRLETL